MKSQTNCLAVLLPYQSGRLLIATGAKCGQSFENGLVWLLPGICGLSLLGMKCCLAG